MEVWTVISGIVVLLPATFSVDGLGTTYKGSIQVNTVTCSFAEYRNKDGRGPRGLRLSSCTSNKTLDCTYYGENPHNCKAYKPEQQKSIKKYYSALAESAMNNGDPCTLSSITENICDLSYLCYDGSCKENHPKEEL